MATKENEGIHGEREDKARFGNVGPDSESRPGSTYDREPGDGTRAYTGTPDSRAGDPSNPRGEFNRSALKEKEGLGGTAALSPHEAAVRELEDLAGLKHGTLFRKETDAESQSRFGKFKARAKKASKKQVATLAIVGVLGGGGLFGGAVLQGPLQFIHFAQKLQKLHFTGNEDFGNRRLQKAYYYAKGDGQKSRLGITTNKAADAWEKKLLADTGMRPIYQSGSKRFIGFEIVDDNKAQRVLGDTGDNGSRSSARVQQSLGNGARITEARNRPGVANNTPDKIPGDRRIIDLQDVSFADRKAWIKTIGNATQTNKMTSSLASRLLVKRGGVNFHPLNKLKGKMDDSAARRIQERRNKDISEGTESVEARNAASTEDENGNKNVDPADQAASDETQKLIDDVKAGRLKTFSAAAAGPAAVIGILCTAQGLGENVEDYKYVNNVLPMMRMGMQTISTGNQIMSGNDVDMATLGQLTQYMYDQEQKTSWTQAESLRVEEGKSGGTKMPEEADLGTASEKPALFRTLDKIPGLAATCGAINGVTGAILGLPGIKQVTKFATDAATSGIDAALGIVDKDLSVETIGASAMKAIAGKAIDPEAKGANYGNLANTGAFLAANDQAVAMGGRDLSDAERVNVAMMEKDYLRAENASKPLMARYFNPLDSDSAVASLIDATPASPAQAANMVANPLKSFASTFSSTFGLFSPKASAATYIYDYGMPQTGFSVDEMQSDLFENPYENAMRTNNEGKTLEDELPRLNEDYGWKCFGMKINTDDAGVHLETRDKSEMKDVYKARKEDAACKETNDRLKQYRMYIADAVTAITASCNEGEETACTELGINGAAGVENADDAGVAGEGAGKIVSVAEKEFAKNGNKPIESCGANCGPEVQKYTGGPSGISAPWCAWFVSWVYREAGYEFKGAPAGSDGNIPAVASLLAWFKEHGKHFTPESSIKPQPGDVVMYGGNDHTGIVVKVDGDNIETIEGNTSGDGSYNADGGTVGRKKYNYKTYTSRSIDFGRLKSF